MRHVFIFCTVMTQCSLLLFSCSPKTAGVALNTETMPASLLIAKVRQQSEKLKSLQGKGTLSFDSPEMAGTAWFTSVLKRPDSLLVHLEGPFGISVGTLFLSREHYVMYNSLENRVTSGMPSRTSIRGVIPFDLTYDQLVDAFAGIFGLPADAENVRGYSLESGSFLLSELRDTTVCDYWVDPESFLVTRVRQRDMSDRTIVEASATSPAQEGEALAPRKIMISFPREHRQISITYSSVTLNSPDISFAFSIPQSAETTIR